MELNEEFRKAVSYLFGQNPNIVFVGMSNMGKTHWSKPMAQYLKMPRIDFDDVIGKSSAIQELTDGIEGKDEAERMGKFFDMPWTAGFEEREKSFLNAENAVMKDKSNESNTILDLTGSAFLHEDAMKKIANSGLVIYLEASPEAQVDALAGLVQGFKDGPKPVCWGEVSKPRNEEELKKSFGELLVYRAKNYAEYADVTIPYKIHKNMESVEGLMGYILQELKKDTPTPRSDKLVLK